MTNDSKRDAATAGQSEQAASAKPTAKVGLDPVPGSGPNYMYLNAAPALDQAIDPKWTGAHQFDGSILVPTLGNDDNSRNAASTAFVHQLVGSSPGSDTHGADPTAKVGLEPVNGAATTFMRSDAAPALDQTISPVWTGQHEFTREDGIRVPTQEKTDHSERAASTQFVHDVVDAAITSNPGSDAHGADPTAKVGLEPVNGTATTFMRSDAAPALDQSIAPVWTGGHKFAYPSTRDMPSLQVSNSNPQFEISYGGECLDDYRRWNISVTYESWVLRTLSDAGDEPHAAITITRDRVEVKSIALEAEEVTVPDVPDDDSSDKAANTRFVKKALAAGPYSLPKATTSTLGGIIVGQGLKIDEQGVLSTVAGESVAPPFVMAGSVEGTIASILSNVKLGSRIVTANATLPKDMDGSIFRLGTAPASTGMTFQLYRLDEHFALDRLLGNFRFEPGSHDATCEFQDDIDLKVGDVVSLVLKKDGELDPDAANLLWVLVGR